MQTCDEGSYLQTHCPLCNFHARNHEEFILHRDNDDIHLYNFLVYQYQKHRFVGLYEDQSGTVIRREAKNPRHGVYIDTYCDGKKIEVTGDGTVKTVIASNREHVVYEFIVRNALKNRLHLQIMCAMLMHPYLAFSIEDERGISRYQSSVVLTPGSKYNVKVTFRNCGIGTYGVPVRFELSREDLPYKRFYISRLLVVNVTELAEYEYVDLKDNPFLGEAWVGMADTVPGRLLNGGKINQLLEYAIPDDLVILLKNNLVPFYEMSEVHALLLCDTLTVITMPFPKDLDSYVKYFHTFLYMEEYYQAEQLEKYNMSNVAIKVISDTRVELKVPGLAEKRPSVLSGDLIYLRVSDQEVYECIQYEAVVAEVRETVIWIGGFNPELMNHLEMEGKLHFDVRFTVNRFPMFVMHRALKILANLGFNETIFPDHSSYPPLPIDDCLTFYNPLVARNPEQKKAVCSIVRGTSRPSPFILHGPPGTGKTMTIVEAILQIKKISNSHILVCAPSNAACDLLAQKLAPHCTRSELLRLHSSSRDWESIPADIHKFSNLVEKKYYFPKREVLYAYRIIVCTLISSGRLLPKDYRSENLKPSGHFTHVFIDECGQASEPQCLVPQAGILSQVEYNKLGGQVILCGDPEQLGPVCVSAKIQAEFFTTEEKPHPLSTSLLERLMKTCNLYMQQPDGTYNDNYIVKLCRNYRSHPQILKLANKLIYEDKLLACCGPDVKNDTVKNMTEDPKLNMAVIMHGVLGQERREGRSPSFFNTFEMERVMWYIEGLLKGGVGREPVPETDIGIIAPYIRQVYKLKAKLKETGRNDVEVGTTETFQGREKRVIIISTVRSNRDLLDYDMKYNLGFVANKKRFNVAITRARSLLILVGNPHLLDRDENWNELINYTQKIGSYRGCDYTPRKSTGWRDYVIGNLICFLAEGGGN